jgi:phosphohistidine phosphatase SixA
MRQPTSLDSRLSRAFTATLALLAMAGCAGAPVDPPATSSPPAATAPSTATAAAPAGSLDALADRYVELALSLGEHDPDYVDAWLGSAEQREAAKARGWDLAAVGSGAGALLTDLLAFAAGDDGESALRRSFLVQQVRAMAARVALLRGERRPFDEESLALYGVVAPHRDAAHFEAVIAEVATLLPAGEGTVAERLEAYRRGFVIPPERLDAVFRAAIAACRERTAAHIELPAGESFRVEYVTDKPWSGYNWYQGNFHSLIQVNTDLPIFIDRAVDLACHEGYPGHHVYNLLHEQRLVRERGWREHLVQPLFAPQALVMEGSANHGREMAFPTAERLAFERATIFPLAGLDPATADGYYRVLELTKQLSHAGNQAARRYLDGEIDAEAAVEWLVQYGLSSPERARQRISFFDKYRSYVVNYNVGEELVAAWLDARQAAAGGDPQARWAAFARLLSEPLGPAELLADLPADAPGAPATGTPAPVRALATAPPAVEAPATEIPAPVAFLVRHAEKDPAGGADPALTAAGRERAEKLATLLADQGILRILTTDTRRARETAAPLAARLGLTPERYDHRRLADLAAELRSRGERVLVVGHSNTTGELAALFGGDSGGPIADDEYDRLYRVTLGTGEANLSRY